MPALRRTQLIDVLMRAMSDHDPDTAHHLEAVGRLAQQTAWAMELDAVTVARCRDAARVHDIGKLDLDVRLLRSKEALTASEWEIVKLHPIRGERLLRGIPLLAPLAPIVGAHHERIDGRGYPGGRLGPEIPLESRLIAVVDAFHAMIGWRSYKRAISVNCALTELVAHSGTQFDATIVHAFVAALAPTYPSVPRAATGLV